MSERPVERQQRVRAQILIRRKFLVISVFRNRSPPSEQRPHRSVVVSPSAENRRAVRNDSHSPIRLLVRTRQLLNRGHCRRVTRQPKPHRNRCQHCRFVHLLVILVQRERKPFFVRDPKTVVHQRPLLCKFIVQRRCRIHLS